MRCLLVLLGLSLAAYGRAASNGEGGALQLRTVDGQELAGRWTAAGEGRIGVLAPEFEEALLIETGLLEQIDFEINPAEARIASGEFEFELQGGERLHGQLIEVSDDFWTIDLRGGGRVEIPRSFLLSAENLGGDGMVLHSLTGLAGWKQRSKKQNWECGDEVLFTESAKSGLERDLGLDESRDLEFTLAWTGEPHFRVGIGHRSRAAGERVTTIEPWGTSLVAWRDDGMSGFEVVELTNDLQPDSKLFLRTELRPLELIFYGEGEVELGRMLRSENEKAGPCLSITSDGGRLELRSLRVLRPGVSVTPQRILAESVLAYDSESGVFTLIDGEVLRGEVLGFDFPESSPLDDVQQSWLSYIDGRRIGGRICGSADDAVILKPRWSEEEMECSLDGLQSVRFSGGGESSASSKRPESFVLTAGSVIAGELDSIDADGRIVWKPSVSGESATIDPGRVKRVILNRTTEYYVSGRKFPHYLRLRSGDTFRCKLLSATEDSIRFVSPFGGERALDVTTIKAIEFDPRAMESFREIFEKKDEPRGLGVGWGVPDNRRRETSEGFDADSLERAMALPRKYKKRPFKHLILARNGDFLRTRLLGWDPAGARFPGLASETRTLPSQRIAAIVWLEPDENGGPPAPDCQVKLDDLTRVSITLTGTGDGKLFGTSPALGELELELSNIISIDLDPEVLQAPGPYEEWVLKPMKEPFPDQPKPAAGPKLSEAAPKTEGKDLDGKKIALSDFRGKVVLLHFWAHW